MSSLTETALLSKKAFFWMLVAFAVIIAFLTFMGIGKSIARALFPPANAPALVAFGKLPAPNLSAGYKAPGGATYELQTVSGSLTELATQAKVFRIFIPTRSFSDTATVRSRAGAVGFTSEPFTTSTNKLIFTHPQDQTTTLTMDSFGNDPVFETNYLSNANVLANSPGDTRVAVDAANRFFQQMGLPIGSYPMDKVETRLLRIDGGALTPTITESTANLIEVDFNPAEIDSISAIWTKKNPTPMYALVWQGQVVYAKAEIPLILKSFYSTYPLKGVTKAYEDLTNGLGYFNAPITSSRIVILDATLGYAFSENAKDYIQPIYIFKTSEGPLGYVRAVDDSWINPAPAQ